MSWLKPRPTKILAVATQTLKWPVHKRRRTRQPRNTQAEACTTSIQRHTLMPATAGKPVPLTLVEKVLLVAISAAARKLQFTKNRRKCRFLLAVARRNNNE